MGTQPAAEGISTGTAPARLLVLARNGWPRGASYRVRLTSGLEDELGRRFGRSESLEWRVPEAPAAGTVAAVLFDKRIYVSYETWEAATNTVDNRFPGGQTALFQGLWTDPITGVAYARARWYDARNAAWLSEDPMADIDSPNRYAFVGWQPNMSTDPQGLCVGPFKDLTCGELVSSFLSVDAAKRSGEFLVGEVKGLYNTGKGIVHTALHPIETGKQLAEGAGYLAANWDRIDLKQVATNAFDAYVNASSEKQGEVFGEVVLSTILLGGVGKTAEAERLAGLAREVASLSKWGDELGDAAMLGFREGAIEATAEMAPQITEQAITRQRVLGNIARSQAAREASNFGAHVAREAQALSGYTADAWEMTTLSKGSLIYGGSPGQTAFYTSFETVKESGLIARPLFESLQVAPHSVYGYRAQIQAYRLLRNIRVPAGMVNANPALGAGGGFQFFVQRYSSVLSPVRSFNLVK